MLSLRSLIENDLAQEQALVPVFQKLFLSLCLRLLPLPGSSWSSQLEQRSLVSSAVSSFVNHLLRAKPCARDWRHRKSKTRSPPWVNSPPNGENLEASGNYIPVAALYWWGIQDVTVMEGEAIVSYSYPCAFREGFLEMETSELEP